MGRTILVALRPQNSVLISSNARYGSREAVIATSRSQPGRIDSGTSIPRST